MVQFCRKKAPGSIDGKRSARVPDDMCDENDDSAPIARCLGPVWTGLTAGRAVSAPSAAGPSPRARHWERCTTSLRAPIPGATFSSQKVGISAYTCATAALTPQAALLPRAIQDVKTRMPPRKAIATPQHLKSPLGGDFNVLEPPCCRIASRWPSVTI